MMLPLQIYTPPHVRCCRPQQQQLQTRWYLPVGMLAATAEAAAAGISNALVHQ
jgi:hypothetical protein